MGSWPCLFFFSASLVTCHDPADKLVSKFSWPVITLSPKPQIYATHFFSFKNALEVAIRPSLGCSYTFQSDSGYIRPSRQISWRGLYCNNKLMEVSTQVF